MNFDREFAMSKLKLALRYWYTLRCLRPVQFYARVWYRFVRPNLSLSPPPELRALTGKWCLPSARKPSLMGSGAFLLLNEAGDLSIDGWDNPLRDKLWRYNQHYFDDLNARGAIKRVHWHYELIFDWIGHNPIGTGTGWEPYPTSLRIVNWIKWALRGNELPAAAIASLAMQVRWLCGRLEWHLLGNHLFSNAKALIFAGYYFEGGEAKKWRDLGFRILAREVPEQILPDGGQFELSPMYHALALEDMLDLVNVSGCYSLRLTARQVSQVVDWRNRLPAMMHWLEVMCHLDGDLAFFNDTAIGVAPTKRELANYAARLNIKFLSVTEQVSWLKNSGYIRFSSGFATVIADVARVGPDYLPAHAHADTLSFEFSLGGERLIVNSGTSAYGISPERSYQRSTAAHSTLTLDKCDSSEVWSGFRVARRAYPMDVEVHKEGASFKLQAAHNGYARLPGEPIHRRRWILEGGSLRIIDEVTGAGRHCADIRFHLAPGVVPHRLLTGDIILEKNHPHTKVAKCRSVEDVVIDPSTWHPEFGASKETFCLRVSLDGNLPLAHEMVFCWEDV